MGALRPLLEVVARSFNLSTWEAEADRFHEFHEGLVYRASSIQDSQDNMLKPCLKREKNA